MGLVGQFITGPDTTYQMPAGLSSLPLMLKGSSGIAASFILLTDNLFFTDDKLEALKALQGAILIRDFAVEPGGRRNKEGSREHKQEFHGGGRNCENIKVYCKSQYRIETRRLYTVRLGFCVSRDCRRTH